MNSEIIIYQNQKGDIKIDVRLEGETVWLTQDQMATLFGKGKSTIAEHIANVLDEAELEQNRTCRKFRQEQLRFFTHQPLDSAPLRSGTLGLGQE